jgi:hypothetical protein
MIDLSKYNFEPEENYKIEESIRVFNSKEGRIKNMNPLIDKLEIWLAGTTSKGNLQYYEMAKKYCAEITSSPSDYEYLIKYLSKRIKI